MSGNRDTKIWASHPSPRDLVEFRYSEWDADSGIMDCHTRQLVGPGAPFESVEQMADDLRGVLECVMGGEWAWENGPPDVTVDRVAAAIGVLDPQDGAA